MLRFPEVIKRMRPAYILAISLVASFIIFGQSVAQYVGRNRSDDAHTINIAGRQRMLCQRISNKGWWLAHQILSGCSASAGDASSAGGSELGPEIERRLVVELDQAVLMWRRSHYDLQTHPLTLEDARHGGELSDRMEELDSYVEIVAEDVERIIETINSDSGHMGADDVAAIHAAVASIGLATDEYLPKMNEIVFGLDQRSTGYVSQFGRLQFALSVGCLIVLGLTAAVILEPATRLLQSTLGELRMAKAKAIQAANEAAAANAAKSEFLSNMSHEIRTPMTAILGYTDLIINEEAYAADPQHAREAMFTVRRNANHLLTVIDDILDVSKIEAGQIKLEIIPASIVEIIQDVDDLSRPKCEAKGMGFRVEYESAVPSQVLIDPTRLRQILLNLVGNAVKFTEHGEVSLVAGFDSQSQCLSISVRDTGIGMTPGQLAAIGKFDAFTQADTSTTRQYGGSGLGLRISNYFAELLGGRLEVDSVYGQGSQFTVRFNARLPESASMIDACNFEARGVNPTTEVAEAKQLDGMRVLLAEDGEDNQRLIQFLLEKEGAEVRVVPNGRDAVDACFSESESFDIVLMDMQMPIMDGYTAAGVLRQEDFSTPIVALTAHAMSSDRQRCLEAGCTDYISKPIDRKKLIETVRRVGSTRVVRSALA